MPRARLELLGVGADSHLAAALALYRALRVYPAPGELMQIYQKTIKVDVLKMVMELIELDVSHVSFRSLCSLELGFTLPTEARGSWYRYTVNIYRKRNP